MPPIDLLIAFTVASTLLALTPGPDNIFVMTQSAMSGRISGVLVTLGLCSGLLVHTAAVAFGVAAIFQKYDVAFNALKVVGALYLLYLAWQAFRAKPAVLELENSGGLSYRALYFRGIVMNITNPKVSIFFLAFLPQFAHLEYGPLMPQIFVLGLVFLLTALVVFSAIAFLADLVKNYLIHSKKSQLILNRASGFVFCGLALKLLLLER